MKSTARITALFLLALPFYVACNTPSEAKVTPEDAKPEIQALEDAFSAGEKAKDVNAVAAYYADDAVSYHRNEAPSVGIASIKKHIAKGMAEDSVGDYNEYKVIDLYANGEAATEIGSWTKFSSAGEKKDNGYYMSYFEKRDGKYRCVRDMSVKESPEKPSM